MSSCVYGVLVKPPPERETLQGGWHADWVRCPQAWLARRSFVWRARGRELVIAMAVAKLYLARMLQRTLPAGLNGDDLGREPIEFNARGGALPDCLVNTQFAVAHGSQLPAERLLGDCDAEFLEDPLRQIDQPPAHHAMHRRDRATLDHAGNGLPLSVVELGRLSCRLAIHETVRTVAREAQH